MKRINKSKIALFAALVSTLNVNCDYKTKAMNGDTLDFAASAMSSISSSLASGNSNPAWLIPGLIIPVGLVIGGVLLDQKLERDKVARTVISSLKSKSQLENIKGLLADSKNKFEKIFKENPMNFVGEKVKLGIGFDVNKLRALDNQSALQNNFQNNPEVLSSFRQIFDLKKMLGNITLSEELSVQMLFENIKLCASYALLVGALEKDENVLLKFDKADIPFSIDFIRSKKNPNDNRENLSVICSMNFISSKFDYSNRHQICIRMRDNKFELLVDGSSYDIDELSKKLG